MEISVEEMAALGKSVAEKAVLTVAIKTTVNPHTADLIRDKLTVTRSGCVKCSFDVGGKDITLAIALGMVERGYEIVIAFPEEANAKDVFDAYAQVTELAMVFWTFFLKTNPDIAALLAEEGIGELIRDKDTLYLRKDSMFRVGITAGYFDSLGRPWRP